MRNDLDYYVRHADEWWDTESPWFRSLHRIHRFREWLLRRWIPEPWTDLRIADLGCGGGLLSETFGRAGAHVIGVDLGFENLRAAIQARTAGGGRRCYVQARAELLPMRPSWADGVLLADVLEHVPDYRAALKEAAAIAAPGAWMFANTISRTLRSRLLAVTLAEGLRLIPPGTHDPRLFIRPEELRAAAADAGFEQVDVQGERPLLLRTIRDRAIHVGPSRDLSVAYSAFFRRRG
jgi:2-polyprenyl-6-hydroxyphenyl methylase/3-demethylubiquinone-9 3-methyltransferase